MTTTWTLLLVLALPVRVQEHPANASGDASMDAEWLDVLALLSEELGDPKQLVSARDELQALAQKILASESGMPVLARLDTACAKAGLTAVQVEVRRRKLDRGLVQMGPDAAEIPGLQMDVADALYGVGQAEEARAIYLGVMDRLAVLCSEKPDCNDLLRARSNLAATENELGHPERALPLQTQVLETYERLHTPDHEFVLRAKSNLAITYQKVGDLERALSLQQESLFGLESKPEQDTQLILLVKGNLAGTLSALGDWQGAHSLNEAVLHGYSRFLPPDHRAVLMAKLNLARSRAHLGDREGALALQEEVVSVLEKPDAQNKQLLLEARSHVAESQVNLGAISEAQTTLDEILTILESSTPSDPFRIAAVTSQLAKAKHAGKELQPALALFEKALAMLEERLPAEDDRVVNARQSIAAVAQELGDLERAAAIQEVLLASERERLPEGDRDLLISLGNLARTRFAAGKVTEARGILLELIDGQMLALRRAALESTRAAQSIAGDMRHRLQLILFLAGETDCNRQAFELVETRRHVSQGELGLASLKNLDATTKREALAKATRELAQRIVKGPSGGPDELEHKRKIQELSLLRDDLEAGLVRLAGESMLADGIRVEALSRALSAGDLVAGYLRYRPLRREDKFLLEAPEDHLLAFVLQPAGDLQRIELGPLARIAGAVERWRTALGKPLGHPGKQPLSAEEEIATGRELRRLLIDPVLGETGSRETRTLYVCPDDCLFLVPLDALPMETDERLGDQVAIRTEVSFGRLVRPAKTSTGTDLLAMGDIDFDSKHDSVPASLSRAEAILTDRSATFGRWPRLPGTREEVERLARRFEEATDEKPMLLLGSAASKAGFLAEAPGKRFLHLATHGWFAPESILAVDDADLSLQGPESVATTVTGFAPLTLCGLCLSGANRWRDEGDHLQGLLTAEELASVDLSSCELAVLSACETNVGTQRAGLGLRSLQSALHLAGTRSSLTSLWRVDDQLTKELMDNFYEGLLTHHQTKSDALWNAKTALRQKRYPTSSWAGWVLVGDPRYER